MGFVVLIEPSPSLRLRPHGSDFPSCLERDFFGLGEYIST
jgi:hypothetical protein